MRRLLWCLPLAMFFLNPNLGCGGPEFDYGAAEMRAAVEGNWSLTVMPEGAPAAQVTLRIEQGTSAPAQAASEPRHGLVRQAHACGTRTLVKPAAACGDSSQMPLQVTMVSGDATFTDVALGGMLTVYGLTFVTGWVELTLGDRRLIFTVDRAGNPTEVRFGPSPGTAAIARQG